MNSAVVTNEGVFNYQLTDREKALDFIDGGVDNFSIGYEATCDIFNETFGTNYKSERSMVSFEVGDMGLVFRMNCRIPLKRKGNLTREELYSYLEMGFLTRVS